MRFLFRGLPVTVHVSLESCPALVLNADYRPLSYYPLSLWSWQDAIKAIFLERVHVVSSYDRIIKSPSFEMFLPSVVSLKDYVRPARHPAFTRFNVFLRVRFQCQSEMPGGAKRWRAAYSSMSAPVARRNTCARIWLAPLL